MRACEVDPLETGRCRECTPGRRASPKSAAVVHSARPSRPGSSTACHAGPPRSGRPARPGSSHGPPPRPVRSGLLGACWPGWLGRSPRSGCPAGRPRPRQPAGAGRSTRRRRGRAVRAPAGPYAPGPPRRRPRRPGRRPGALGGRGRGGLRRGGRRPRGGVGRPPGRPAHDVRAGQATVRARRPGRRRRGRWAGCGWRRPLPAGGLPALGAAPGRRPISTRCRCSVPARVRLLPVWGSRRPRSRRPGAGRAGRAAAVGTTRRRSRRRVTTAGAAAARLAVGAAAAAVGTASRRCSAAGERRPRGSAGQVGGQPAVVGRGVVRVRREPDEAAAVQAGDRRPRRPTCSPIRSCSAAGRRPGVGHARPGSGTSCMLTAGVTRQVGSRTPAAPRRPRCWPATASSTLCRRSRSSPRPSSTRSARGADSHARRVLGAGVVEGQREALGLAPRRDQRAQHRPPALRGVQHRRAPRRAAPLVQVADVEVGAQPVQVDGEHPGCVRAVDEHRRPRAPAAPGRGGTSGSRRAVGEVTWSSTTSRVRSCTAPSTASTTSSSSAVSGTCTDVDPRAPVGSEPLGGDPDRAVARGR